LDILSGSKPGLRSKELVMHLIQQSTLEFPLVIPCS
jgi:hypothetical protein